ncbi:dihydroorotate dehydrogenase [Candidatus Bathyarchaeota archaeon]|nr:dihydroorotate dehydrogenase [Candidatus Bathyarchaeota archaeon]
MSQLSLSVDIAGLRLRNPTMNAAGVLGISASLLKRVYEGGAGAVVTKSLGPAPRSGHFNPTMVIVEGGVLNAMGLPNPGAEYFVSAIKALRAEGVPVVASFFGASIEDFRDVAELLSEAGADALEVNVSCPNVQEELGMLGADCLNTEKVTAAVKEVSKPPVFVKLSPNVTDIAEIAKAAEMGGADAITAVNTLKGMAIDADFKRPILTNVTGGLSGPALKSVALRCVWDIVQAVDLPVVGCGGVANWRDAVEFMLAGASAVEVGTAIRERGFGVYKEITTGIEGYLEANGFGSIKDIVGLAQEAA